MSEEKPVIHKGLEGIYVYETQISYIDGFNSRLYYRGYRIEDLANYGSYEETVYLLWYGKLPTKKELENFKGNLRENMEIPEQVKEIIRKIPRDTHPMEALRTAVSFIGNFDPGKFDLSLDAMFRKAIRLTAKFPTIIAAIARARQGLDIIDPDPRLSLAENFLYMLNGKRPPEFWARAMDLSNILYAVMWEHYRTQSDRRYGGAGSGIFKSIDGGNTWKAASDDIVVDDLDVDQNVTILVRGDIPELGDDPKVSDGDVINIQLKAIAVKDGTTDAEENTGDSNGNDRKDTEDTILAEGDDIVGSDKYDGSYIAWGGYIVHTPLLSVSKNSCVLEDPVNGQSEKAKRIPGATILYIIDIHNSSTTTDASDVNITDTLQSDLDGSTVANLKYDDGQDSCSCSNGTAYSGGTAATDADSDDQKIEVDNLTVTKDKHNCVSFEVDIK